MIQEKLYCVQNHDRYTKLSGQKTIIAKSSKHAYYLFKRDFGKYYVIENIKEGRWN